MERSENERSYLLKEAIREALDDPERTTLLKSLFKEALTEWLDDKWATFGKWTFRGLGAAVFTIVLYLLGKAKGVI